MIHPVLYNPRLKRSVSSSHAPQEDGGHAHHLSMSYRLKGKEVWLDLQLNKELIPQGYFEKHHYKVISTLEHFIYLIGLGYPGKESWLSHIQNTGRWNYSTLASRWNSIYLLGFYVLVSFPSLELPGSISQILYLIKNALRQLFITSVLEMIIIL